MIDKDKLAAQMREAVDYLKSVELPSTPIRIDVSTVQLNPKKYFATHVSSIRSIWKNDRAVELAVYHFLKFYHAVKKFNDEGGEVIEQKEQKPVDRAPAKKTSKSKQRR